MAIIHIIKFAEKTRISRNLLTFKLHEGFQSYSLYHSTGWEQLLPGAGRWSLGTLSVSWWTKPQTNGHLVIKADGGKLVVEGEDLKGNLIIFSDLQWPVVTVVEMHNVSVMHYDTAIGRTCFSCFYPIYGWLEIEDSSLLLPSHLNSLSHSPSLSLPLPLPPLSPRPSLCSFTLTHTHTHTSLSQSHTATSPLFSHTVHP